MSINTLQPEIFEARRANEAVWAALNTFENRLRLEEWPDDPPEQIEETIQNIQSIPPFVDLSLWVVWSAESK